MGKGKAVEVDANERKLILAFRRMDPKGRELVLLLVRRIVALRRGLDRR